MNKSKLILLFSFLTFGRIYSQNIADTINKIAIDCKDLTLPNDNLDVYLKSFKCICIGELHGTK